MAEIPCPTCQEEYEAMVEAQAERRAAVRAYHDRLIAESEQALATLSPSEKEIAEVAFVTAGDEQAQAAELKAAAEAASFVAPDNFQDEEQPAVLLPSDNGREPLEDVKQPAKNASRQDWVDYVAAVHDVNEAALEGESRDDLAKKYGS